MCRGSFVSLLLTVSVGYEYESCPDLILWEKRTAVLQGYEIDASKLGGWSLDKHHALNIQSGRLAVAHNQGILQCGKAQLLIIKNSIKRKGEKSDQQKNSILFSTNKFFVESTFRSNLVRINPKEADSCESDECP